MLTIPTKQYLLRSPIRARRETTESRVASRRRMRSSILAGFILLCYRVFNCQRRWRIGRWWIQLAFRLEGGPMWSTTARRIMRDFHGVDIGDYSYGNCFDPAVVPPGVSIGRYVSIAPNARMIVQNHPLDRFSTHPIFYEQQPGVAETAELPPGHLEVGHDVWIGYNAVVTPGCNRIGTGSIIGAGAVPPPWWGALLYGAIIALAGMLGDLSESLLKRDMECKDSSNWLPGLGGILDILDSVLAAAPPAFVCWAAGIV